MTQKFVLDARIEQTTRTLGDFPLSRVLWVMDRRYPWVILVPRRPGVREIFELTEVDRHQLLEESCAISRALHLALGPDKINVAAIGNQVPQLHLHHVARFVTDGVWPAPVWGRGEAVPYAAAEAEALIGRVLSCLSLALRPAE